MNKKTAIKIRNYKQDFLNNITLYKDIISDLEEIIEEEQDSIDNMSDYPQFMDKVMDMEEKSEEVINIKENLEEAIESLTEAIDHIEMI